MRILVACEESQAVTIEMRRLGHEAYSCDIQDCSGGHPEWHIKGDALALINGNCRFQTMDGEWHEIEGPWDMLIAHPPCTFLSNAGACRLYPRKGQIDLDRYAKGLVAKAFFLALYNANCPRIAVENPLPSSVFELPPLHNGYIRIKCNARTKGLFTRTPSARGCGWLALNRLYLQARTLCP